MPDPAVRVEVRPDRVAVLTIDQPGAKVNVLTVALWDELEVALDALPPDLAGLVIASGKPGCFIAGADLKLLADATPGDPAVKAFIEQGLRVLAKLEALPFPTCAAIDGVALGGGLELALACDLRVMSADQKYRIGVPEVNLGLIPGWGGTQRLPRLIGLARALPLLVEGRQLDLFEAISAGVVTFVEVPSDFRGETLDEIARFVGTLPRPFHRKQHDSFPDAAKPPPPPLDASTAAREVYRVATDGLRLPLADGIKLETEAFLRLAGSDESRGKIAAFFAARKR
ncbi:enoyl-CoA hydratase-related protein [Urbifossiella limnaea]|uniref:Fatty acid oxidation complex subunit alpha n=1 Tax=Urbifossiella limnaea TaxID=2528023 RepID=A0A517XPN5_9BACT|nr:enoyl-CoA hydratase-related protein [Urbifossiella limnaea]QDU19456.1 Fatty acid oxidation complex subunit alpha [Urbifossiella limnaea]